MGTGAPVGARHRGLGLGWDQVAAAVAARIPVAEVDRIWTFAPHRQEGREWGTAVVLRRLEGERRRVYTATYMIATRGRERGQTKIGIEEVGDSPSVIVEDVIAGVQERAGDAEPPTEIRPRDWFGEDDRPETAELSGPSEEESDDQS